MVLEALMSWDAAIFNYLNIGIANPALDALFLVAIQLGSVMFWLIMAAILWFRKDKKTSTRLVLGIALSIAVVVALKFLFFRPRPFESMIARTLVSVTDPSFPSGHAANAFLGASLLANKYRKWSVPLYGLAVLVLIGRVYVGVHYPLDVIAGASIGLLLSYAVRHERLEPLRSRIEALFGGF